MKKILKSLGVKAYILWNERKFHFNEHKLRYMYINNRSEKFCVVFSGFPVKGKMPTYKYMRTLGDNQYDYLYIKDDMVNIPHGGSYYLGSNGDYWGIEAVNSLIEHFLATKNPQIKVTVGSSKGGTAALMFGIMNDFDYAIIGACQYRIGTYLNCDYHRNTLRALTGKEHPQATDIDKLDSFVPEILKRNNESKIKIFFQYSDVEHTFQEQIVDLLRDLKENGFKLREDICDYKEHSDVKNFFPEYLKQCLREVSSES